jgi:hypothetical protein
VSFKVIRESISGAPSIEFLGNEDTMIAELAGAKLRAETGGSNTADVKLVDADGKVLADIVIRAHTDNLTNDVADVGSALLWSHWRWAQAEAEKAGTP